MSVLVLARHAQAAAFEQDSDRLTELGERQARALGAWWARRGAVFDEAYCGTLVRQQRTATLVAEAFADAGLPFPEPRVSADWNEYDAHGILTVLAPVLAERDESFRGLALAAGRARGTADQNRHFQRMFETILPVWVAGGLSHTDVEPFAAFQQRVRAALEGIRAAPGSNRRVVVFTSGGPIGTAVQTAVGAPDAAAIELNWRVRNCSLTEFVFSRNRFSLDSFNGLPHLDDAALWSFR